MKRTHLTGTAALLAAVSVFGLIETWPTRSPADADPDRSFTVIGTAYKGMKRWEPATLICKQGERVRITLVNKIPPADSIHGFQIEAFGVKADVPASGDPTIVEFEADKAGLFAITCHLHAAHIGGQLLVLED